MRESDCILVHAVDGLEHKIPVSTLCQFCRMIEKKSKKNFPLLPTSSYNSRICVCVCVPCVRVRPLRVQMCALITRMDEKLLCLKRKKKQKRGSAWRCGGWWLKNSCRRQQHPIIDACNQCLCGCVSVCVYTTCGGIRSVAGNFKVAWFECHCMCVCRSGYCDTYGWTTARPNGIATSFSETRVHPTAFVVDNAAARWVGQHSIDEIQFFF